MSKKIATQKKRVSVFFPPVSTGNSKNAEPNKKRVCAYCRVSTTDEDQLNSYKAQIDYYREYLSNHEDYVNAGIFADEGVTGTSIKKREGFQKMLEACRNGEIDMVITKSVSRFGRNTVDCLNVVRELRSLNIDVYFEKENIHSIQSEGELLLTLMMAIAEAEIYSLSENVKWGMIKRFEQNCNETVNCAPFGYVRTPEGLAVNETEAVIIRRIFGEILDGYTYGDIVRRLVKDSIPTARGNINWSITVLMQMLKNEAYRGDLCLGKSYVVDPISKKSKKNNGEMPRYYASNAHEYIIEPTLWDCVQLEMKRRSDYWNNHRTRFNFDSEKEPFAGRVICGSCGFAFVKDSHSLYMSCSSLDKFRNSAERKKFTCHDIRIKKTDPKEAFMKAWNMLVPIKIDDTADILIQFRVKQLNELLNLYGKLKEVPSELVLKTLNHIEVGRDGIINVVFLAGVKVGIVLN